VDTERAHNQKRSNFAALDGVPRRVLRSEPIPEILAVDHLGDADRSNLPSPHNRNSFNVPRGLLLLSGKH
jgi:hypothetical protein